MIYKLLGYDSFEGGPDAWYPLGEFTSYSAALLAGLNRLVELQHSQPRQTSGVQDENGIHQVFVEHPDGLRERILP
jgi:hypothetical protein